MSVTWYPAYIGLGSNLDQPHRQIQSALKALNDLSEVKVVTVSGFYQSEPYGEVEQDDFINAAAALVTTINAEELLTQMLNIETKQGRKRTQHWGPRCLDLDLLAYSTEQRESEFLNLPHPEISKREFVLFPLAEIAPELMIAGLGRVKTLLSQIPHRNIIKLDKE